MSLDGSLAVCPIGSLPPRKLRLLEDKERKDLATLETANLTVLRLSVAFSFQWRFDQYDLRKNYEGREQMQSAPECVRADLLPASEAENVRHYLKRIYISVASYETRDECELRNIGAITDRLELQLWSSIRSAAASQAMTMVALTASGMNDV